LQAEQTAAGNIPTENKDWYNKKQNKHARITSKTNTTQKSKTTNQTQ
jgi:hypothetical protein